MAAPPNCRPLAPDQPTTTGHGSGPTADRRDVTAPPNWRGVRQQPARSDQPASTSHRHGRGTSGAPHDNATRPGQSATPSHMRNKDLSGHDGQDGGRWDKTSTSTTADTTTQAGFTGKYPQLTRVTAEQYNSTHIHCDKHIGASNLEEKPGEVESFPLARSPPRDDLDTPPDNTDRPPARSPRLPTTTTTRPMTHAGPADPGGLPTFLQNIGYPHIDGEEIAASAQEGDAPTPDILAAADAMVEPDATPTLDAAKWPFPSPMMNAETAYIYDAVKTTGRHNHEHARITLPTALNSDMWAKEATGHAQDHMVLQGVRYGFPIQYSGPPQYTAAVAQNHASARNYNAHIKKYVEEELAHGAMEGPFDTPPFVPWFITSPLMTREKTDSDSRRIIVDLSFPDGGVNKFILPHVFNGAPAAHNLPTIESAVATIAEMCPGQITLAVVDLSRAYRQFPVCPLDWPLLGIVAEGHFLFDRRLPFGARMSSFVMQMAADFIVRALQKRGIKAHMYLDDVVIIAPTLQIASRSYDQTLALIKSLGLEVASNKLQPPSHKVRWLGIVFDADKNLLSIPTQKLEEIKRCMASAVKQTTITKKQLQRIIGVVNHLAKVVRAARLFIGRILAAYRATEGDSVTVSRHIKADFRWFARYLSSANGRAIIPTNVVVLRIWADACLTGAGASDGARFYTYKFPSRMTATHHIAHLEALNCVAAARVFIHKGHAGGTVEILCDNKPSIDAFRSGRARDTVLAACSRALWFKAASTDTTLIFTHVPGEAMTLPDALSRVYHDQEHRDLANELVARLGLRRADLTPDMFSYVSFL